MTPALDAYHELCAWTLSLRDPAFAHQHVVDAFAAQNADERTKPITLTFALVGLYLHVEKGVSGKDVQRVHMQLAQRKRAWPSFPLPARRGSLTAADVLAQRPGPPRLDAIDRWAAEVWSVYSASREAVAELLNAAER